jgi:anti-sigma B factor antagonist/stage II sporulation protein AA (anti-sigma F factor antagonist)
VDLRVEPGDDGASFRIAGDLDVASVSTLLEAVQAAGPFARDVSIDLSDLTFMDSTGLRTLVTISKDLPEGRQLVIAGASPQVRKLMKLVRADLFERWDVRD